MEENLAHRRKEAEHAQRIVDEEVEAFQVWLGSLNLQPTIVDLLAHYEQHADEELARTLKRLGEVSPETREALEIMLRSLVRKLSHEPIAFLKTANAEHSTEYIRLVRRIYGLDEEQHRRRHADDFPSL